MNFDAFTEIIRDNLKDFLPEEFRDVRISVEEVMKLNQTYQALTATKEGCGFVPRINLDSLYEQYCIDTLSELRKVAREVAETIVRDLSRDREEIPAECFTDYEEAKDSLFIRLSDAETNRKLLETLPHREVEGLAVTCHLYFGTEEGSFRSSMVTEALREQLGVSREQLLEDAVKNSPRILPALVEDLGKKYRIDLLTGGDGIELYMLTNITGINGAAALFYPGMMEEIALQLEDSYFVLPSSIHEVMIIPEKGAYPPEHMKEMVRSGNEHCVAPYEKLSDEVFHYDMKARRFELCENWQKRTGRFIS